MDPLSVTTGVFAILSSCIRICREIQGLKTGAALADAAVQALFLDIDDFSRVLELIGGTLDGEKDHVQATGHVGNLWRNVSRSIDEAQKMLAQLNGVLRKVDKNVDLAGGLRKHFRLNAASEEISVYQQQIRTYRDTLQLSMHIIIISKQSSLQGTIQTILPNLDLLHRDFRKTQKEIIYLQNLVQSQQTDSIGDISNLTDTFRSAAEVASSASTILTEKDDTDKLSVILESITAQSELGDFLGQENELTQQWVFSDYNNHSDRGQESKDAISENREKDKDHPGQRRQISSPNSSMATDDLDCVMIQALFHQSKAFYNAKDLGSAKRLLRRCMLEYQLIPGIEIPQVPRYEVTDLLLEILLKQEDWDEAETTLKNQLNEMSDNANDINKITIVKYSLTLAEVLFAKNRPVEAKLYGRKALQGYLSLGSKGFSGVEKTLRLLIQICNSSEDFGDEEAYSAMLSFAQNRVTDSNQIVKLNEDSEASLGPTKVERSVVAAEGTQRKSEEIIVTGNSKAKIFPLPIFHLDIEKSYRAGKVVLEREDRDTKLPGITYIYDIKYPRDFENGEAYAYQVFNHSIFESRKKIVFVGDGCCGKSSLILTFLKGEWFPAEWPKNSFFTVHPIYQEFRDKKMILELWDTQGQEDYDRTRPLCYTDCDVIIMGIGIDNPDSLDSVRERWLVEVRHFLKQVPIILIGMKTDERRNPRAIEDLKKVSLHPVTFDEGKKLSDEIGAIAYIECSAKDGDCVSEVFELATSVAMLSKSKSKKSKDCLIM